MTGYEPKLEDMICSCFVLFVTLCIINDIFFGPFDTFNHDILFENVQTVLMEHLILVSSVLFALLSYSLILSSRSSVTDYDLSHRLDSWFIYSITLPLIFNLSRINLTILSQGISTISRSLEHLISTLMQGLFIPNEIFVGPFASFTALLLFLHQAHNLEYHLSSGLQISFIKSCSCFIVIFDQVLLSLSTLKSLSCLSSLSISLWSIKSRSRKASFKSFKSLQVLFFLLIMPTVSGTTFTLGSVAPRTDGGYSRTTRSTLTGEALIKVKESAVKKILRTPLSDNVQVTTFDPVDMKDKGNFFNFVGNWRSDSKTLIQHMRAYYMHNVFQLMKHKVSLRLLPDGTPDLDNNGNRQYDHAVHDEGSLFDLWHNVEVKAVAHSVKCYAEHAEDVDRQNLQWSWEFFMANVDDDMRHFIMSEVEAYPDHIGQTGPMAFYILSNKIVNSTNSLAHNIVNGVMKLRLHHFDGENVGDCVFVLRNVLKFLNHGHPTFDRTPPTILEYLFDVFMGCSNVRFFNFLQNLKDFHPGEADTPEKLFAKAQSYYHEIISKPGEQWLPIKKKRAAFKVGADLTPPSSPDDESSLKSPHKSPRRKFVVDRTPPGHGEPHTRVNPNTGFTEHFCFKCPGGGRWGNHLSADHDEWYCQFIEKKRRAREGNNRQSSSNDNSRRNNSNSTSSGDHDRRNNSNTGPSAGNNDSGSIGSRTAPRPAPMSTINVSRALRRSYVSFMDSDDEDL